MIPKLSPIDRQLELEKVKVLRGKAKIESLLKLKGELATTPTYFPAETIRELVAWNYQVIDVDYKGDELFVIKAWRKKK